MDVIAVQRQDQRVAALLVNDQRDVVAIDRDGCHIASGLAGADAVVAAGDGQRERVARHTHHAGVTAEAERLVRRALDQAPLHCFSNRLCHLWLKAFHEADDPQCIVDVRSVLGDVAEDALFHKAFLRQLADQPCRLHCGLLGQHIGIFMIADPLDLRKVDPAFGEQHELNTERTSLDLLRLSRGSTYGTDGQCQCRDHSTKIHTHVILLCKRPDATMRRAPDPKIRN